MPLSVMPPSEKTRHGFPEEWRAALAAMQALPHGGVCLVLGLPSRGKSTFAVQAAGVIAGSEEGTRIAIIDADIQDSQLGFPATVAVAWAAPDLDRMQELAPPAAQFFVGGFSVNQLAFELTVAIARAIRWAKTSGASRIAVDLPPLSSSAASRRFIAGLVQTITPDLTIGFCNAPELEDLLSISAAFRAANSETVAAGTLLEGIARKSDAQRELLRQGRMYSAFQNASEMRVSLAYRGADTTYTLNTPLGTGTEIQPHLTRWISQTIRLPVVRAELTQSKRMNLYIRNGTADQAPLDSGAITEHFAVKTIRVIPLSEMIDSYLGLIDGSGALVGVGRFAGLHGVTQEMRIVTSLSRGHQVRIVQFGNARVSQRGSVRSSSDSI